MSLTQLLTVLKAIFAEISETFFKSKNFFESLNNSISPKSNLSGGSIKITGPLPKQQILHVTGDEFPITKKLEEKYD